jgi:hypothetical protein
VTDELAGKQPANSYSVARVQRELSARSRIGALAVHRVAIDSTSNRNSTFALDGRVGIGEAWTVDWWGAKTVTPNRTGDDLGYSVRTGYTTAKYNHNLRIVQVGPDLNPEVGFLNRTGGYRLYDVLFTRFVRRPQWAWFKHWNLLRPRRILSERPNSYRHDRSRAREWNAHRARRERLSRRAQRAVRDFSRRHHTQRVVRLRDARF